MKPGPTIPDDVRRFILLAVPSVPYLEAMLLLRAAHGQAWSGRELASRLYVTESVAEGLLRELNVAGIAVASRVEAGHVHYAYQPRTAELERLIERLAVCHAGNLIGVTHLIHARLERRAQAFADSFKWQKDKP